MCKYSLIGVNGNAFSVMGYVTKAMKKEGKDLFEINAFRNKVLDGNYSNLLSASQDMIDKLNGEE